MNPDPFVFEFCSVAYILGFAVNHFFSRRFEPVVFETP